MKSSRLEQRLNRSILYVIGLLITLVVTFALAGTFTYTKSVNELGIIMSLEYDNIAKRFGQRFVQALIVCSYFLPISLFVTLEITRLIESIMVEADKRMRKHGVNKVIAESKKIKDSDYFADAPAQLSVQVKNSISIENFAELDCIFTDKTGTLTKNLMTFKSYVNIKAQNIDEQDLQQDLDSLFVLALGNTVIPINDDYQGESPDEVAFVKFAASKHLVLTKRSADFVEYMYNGKRILYRMLERINFSSLRKKMSIILQEVSNDGNFSTPTSITSPGIPFIITKGADSFIFPLCKKINKHKQIDDLCTLYSEQGLRTLAFCVAEFNNPDWIKQWKEIQQLEETIPAYITHCQLAEQNLQFVCLSAIEDELQDELKPTLQQFIAAGIKIWMLTGDKTQTAINIAKSSGLSSKDNVLIYFTTDHLNAKNNNNDKSQLQSMINDALKTVQQLANSQVYNEMLKLFEDAGSGKSKMKHIDKQKQIKNQLRVTIVLDTIIYNKLLTANQLHYFFFTSYFAESVVCCRLSPQEKAVIALKYQELFPNYVQLGIGDGANDTFLIQTAHIGVGVAGREGLHACNSADIAIPEFRLLKRLVFVHGRYNHFRNAKMIDYCIYKNALISLINLIYQYYNRFTFQIMTEQFILMLYNTLITFVPIFVFSLFEKDVYERFVENSPEALVKFTRRYHPNFVTLIKDLFVALYHSFLIYFLSLYAYQSGTLSAPQNSNLYGMQTTVMQCCIAVATFRLLLVQRLWNWVTVVFSIIFAYFVLYCIYGFGLIMNSFGVGMIAQVDIFYASWSYSLVVIVISIICLIPEFIYDTIKFMYFPTYEQQLMMPVQNLSCRTEIVGV